MSGPGGGQVPLLSQHAHPGLSLPLSPLSPPLPHHLPLSTQHKAEQLDTVIVILIIAFHFFFKHTSDLIFKSCYWERFLKSKSGRQVEKMDYFSKEYDFKLKQF